MDIISYSLIIIVVVDLILVVITLIGNQHKDKVSLWYLINVATIAWWVGSMFFYRNSSDDNIVALTKNLYVSATFIASSFYYFSHIFPEMKKSFPVRATLVALINLFLVILTIFGNKIILGAKVNSSGENIIYFGQLYFLYVIYILYFFLSSFIRLFIKYLKEKDLTRKAQIFYLVVGYSISGNIAFASNLILPWFHIFIINWLGQISTLCMAVAITYAATRHKLFNTKVIGAELFVFALWIFAFIRTLISVNFTDQITNISFLVLVLIIGFLLMVNVLKEVRQREQIENLAKKLEDTNDNLAHANERLKQLDQAKSEFISLATHQIRSPLTAIKGYISLILEGDYGEVSGKVKEALNTVFESTNNLVTIVGDFLDVSRIELGRMKYEFSDFDLEKLVETVTTEYKPNIEKKGLKFTYSAQPGNYIVHADQGKIKQVIGNIIDNSIKYTPQGSMEISISQNNGAARIKISDTGVGISTKAMPELFQKFTRADNANQVNILGTGLGLYIARQMIEAHHGKIWAESEGEGKGSQFYIELPLIPNQ